MKGEGAILLADDDENDRYFFRLALESAGVPNPVLEFKDGQEVIDFLKGPRPPTSLLVLDLKMPRVSGFCVLDWLRTRVDLRKLPVVIFSASDQEGDVRKAFELGATDYQVKPTEHDKLVTVVNGMTERWLAPAPKAM
jgi:CheY-like chemotaxis protein